MTVSATGAPIEKQTQAFETGCNVRVVPQLSLDSNDVKLAVTLNCKGYSFGSKPKANRVDGKIVSQNYRAMPLSFNGKATVTLPFGDTVLMVPQGNMTQTITRINEEHNSLLRKSIWFIDRKRSTQIVILTPTLVTTQSNDCCAAVPSPGIVKREYPVGDLVYLSGQTVMPSNPQTNSAKNDFRFSSNRLSDAFQAWYPGMNQSLDNGPRVFITGIESNITMTVWQTEQIHDKIAAWLTDRRQLNATPTGMVGICCGLNALPSVASSVQLPEPVPSMPATNMITAPILPEIVLPDNSLPEIAFPEPSLPEEKPKPAQRLDVDLMIAELPNTLIEKLAGDAYHPTMKLCVPINDGTANTLIKTITATPNSKILSQSRHAVLSGRPANFVRIGGITLNSITGMKIVGVASPAQDMEQFPQIQPCQMIALLPMACENGFITMQVNCQSLMSINHYESGVFQYGNGWMNTFHLTDPNGTLVQSPTLFSAKAGQTTMIVQGAPIARTTHIDGGSAGVPIPTTVTMRQVIFVKTTPTDAKLPQAPTCNNTSMVQPVLPATDAPYKMPKVQRVEAPELPQSPLVPYAVVEQPVVPAMKPILLDTMIADVPASIVNQYAEKLNTDGKPTVVFLNKDQVKALRVAIAQSDDARMFVQPKTMTYCGKTVTIKENQQTTKVPCGLNVEVGPDGAVCEQSIKPFDTGLAFQITPDFTADRKFITMDVQSSIKVIDATGKPVAVTIGDGQSTTFIPMKAMEMGKESMKVVCSAGNTAMIIRAMPITQAVPVSAQATYAPSVEDAQPSVMPSTPPLNSRMFPKVSRQILLISPSVIHVSKPTPPVMPMQPIVMPNTPKVVEPLSVKDYPIDDLTTSKFRNSEAMFKFDDFMTLLSTAFPTSKWNHDAGHIMNILDNGKTLTMHITANSTVHKQIVTFLEQLRRPGNRVLATTTVAMVPESMIATITGNQLDISRPNSCKLVEQQVEGLYKMIAADKNAIIEGTPSVSMLHNQTCYTEVKLLGVYDKATALRMSSDAVTNLRLTSGMIENSDKVIMDVELQSSGKHLDVPGTPKSVYHTTMKQKFVTRFGMTFMSVDSRPICRGADGATRCRKVVICTVKPIGWTPPPEQTGMIALTGAICAKQPTMRERYDTACAEGRSEDALKIAMQMLANDPTCFSTK